MCVLRMEGGSACPSGRRPDRSLIRGGLRRVGCAGTAGGRWELEIGRQEQPTAGPEAPTGVSRAAASPRDALGRPGHVARRIGSPAWLDADRPVHRSDASAGGPARGNECLRITTACQAAGRLRPSLVPMDGDCRPKRRALLPARCSTGSGASIPIRPADCQVASSGIRQRGGSAVADLLLWGSHWQQGERSMWRGRAALTFGLEVARLRPSGWRSGGVLPLARRLGRRSNPCGRRGRGGAGFPWDGGA
jgi:hypothetical protein